MTELATKPRALSPQCEVVLAELRAGRVLTHLVDSARLGLNVSQRVSELRRMGYAIEGPELPLKSGKRCSRYYILDAVKHIYNAHGSDHIAVCGFDYPIEARPLSGDWCPVCVAIWDAKCREAEGGVK